MKLQLVDSSTNFHGGYGAGCGETIREKYKCPCGNGIVVYEKVDIPCFRDTDIWCECKKCNEKYEFGKGTAKKIVK